MSSGTGVVVVGVGESQFGEATGKTMLRLHYEAASAALDDAGLSFAEVDGLFSCSVGPALHANTLATYLGIKPTYADSTSLGGGTWETFVEHACAALVAGQCDVALLVYGSNQRTEMGAKRGPRARPWRGGPAEYYGPYGLTTIGAYAMAARRHMLEFGTTAEQLAAVAVSTRANAARNPLATHRDPITVDDVLASPLVADPLHVLDCCLVTDGGGAVVLTRADRASGTRRPPVPVLGAATAIGHDSIIEMDDLTVLDAGVRSSRAAFKQAGITVDDVDLLQVYDSFTITVLLELEALGLCERGEAGPFVEDGRLRFDGALPTNTDGGGLSSNHPGMRGVFLLVEAVRQLRRDDVPWRLDRAPELAVCHGTGGQLSACGTVVLGAP